MPATGLREWGVSRAESCRKKLVADNDRPDAGNDRMVERTEKMLALGKLSAGARPTSSNNPAVGRGAIRATFCGNRMRRRRDPILMLE